MSGRVLVVGGGPAGLYFAGLYKRSFPDRTVTVVEARRAGTAYGFGVVFSETALGYLREADPASHRHLTTALETWQDLTLVHHGCRVAIDGNGFSGIARLELLRILTDFARQSGVAIRHQTRVTPCDLAGQAVVVGADGLHSTVARAGGFRQQVSLLGNRFIWFGTTRVFDTLSLTFRANEDGHFVAHHYRYSPSMSTFIVECDAATFEKAGLETLSAASIRAYCEALFADDLAGHRLLSNRSTWQRFPLKQSEDWYKGTMVLIGDALRSVHFSIGSGTRLALEDAIALWRAFLEYPDDARAACSAFAAGRRPVVDKLLAAARDSSFWYEDLARRMQQTPMDLAFDYMTRSGRVDEARLRGIAPRFMDNYDRHRNAGDDRAGRSRPSSPG